MAHENTGKEVIRSSVAEYLTFITAHGKGTVDAIYANEKCLALSENDGKIVSN